jgi:alkylhydroperoxidase family enzyme
VDDRYAGAIAALEEATLRGHGVLAAEVREAAAFGGELPEPLAAYAEKVRRRAYEIRDEDVTRLREAGLGEDEIFEATAAAAVGAGLARLRAAQRALDGR